MVEAIEPISPKKRKKIYQPFLVVPPPLIPQWTGAILPHKFAEVIFNNASRVVGATLENFQWEKEKQAERTKRDKFLSLIRNQRKLDSKNFSNRRVAIIQAA